MIRFLLLMIVGGGFLIYLGYTELVVAAKTDTEPQIMTCAELAANGPGDNAHIELTDAYYHRADAIIETGSSRRWLTVWVPVVPSDGEYVQAVEQAKADRTERPMLTDYAVIMRSKYIEKDSELGEVVRQPSVRGVVINSIESIGDDEMNWLRMTAPGVDFSKVWIFDHDRKPSGMLTGIAQMGAGLLLAASACWMMLGWLRKGEV